MTRELRICHFPFAMGKTNNKLREIKCSRERAQQKSAYLASKQRIPLLASHHCKHITNKHQRNQRAVFAMNDIICLHKIYKIIFAQPQPFTSHRKGFVRYFTPGNKSTHANNLSSVSSLKRGRQRIRQTKNGKRQFWASLMICRQQILVLSYQIDKMTEEIVVIQAQNQLFARDEGACKFGDDCFYMIKVKGKRREMITSMILCSFIVFH